MTPETQQPPLDFLLVIPAFRESGRLPVYLQSLCKILTRERFTCGILVVDDGSGAAEQQILMQCVVELQRSCPSLLSPLLLERNAGKGAAVLAGWDAGVDAKWVGFVDADGAIPAHEVARVLRHIEANQLAEPCVFTSRIKMLGRKVERSLKRHLFGRIFATMVGLLFCPEIYDSQCGLKLMPARILRQIRPRLQETGFAFDVELLAALLHNKFKVEEIAIDWHDVPGTKVKLLRDTVRMFFSLLRIRQRMKTW